MLSRNGTTIVKLRKKSENCRKMSETNFKIVNFRRIFGTFEFRRPVYLVRDPKLAKQLAIKDFEYFLNHRVLIDENVDKLFGKALFSLQGQKWRGKSSFIKVVTTYLNLIKYLRYASNSFANVHWIENATNVQLCRQCRSTKCKCN